jgi:hypothetical protein
MIRPNTRALSFTLGEQMRSITTGRVSAISEER